MKKHISEGLIARVSVGSAEVQNSAANENSTRVGFLRRWSRPSSDPADERADADTHIGNDVNNAAAMNPEVNFDALKSLESAILEALRIGADSKDISQVVSNATSKFHGSKKICGILACGHNEKSSRLTYRKYFFTLSAYAVMFSMAGILFLQLQLSIEYEFNENEFSPLEQQNLHRAPRESKEEILRTAIAHYDNNAISEFLLNLPKLDLPVNKTENPCPLDAYFHDLCETRNGGTVCLFPGGVLKRITGQYRDREMLALKLLNDTRYFPKTYFVDYNCSYVIQENVNMWSPKKSDNLWCANYTYYKSFYEGAFNIFNANNLIPKDLNTCCNTIVHGDTMRIIDFGQYRFDSPPEKVRLENKERLKDILRDVKEEIEDDQRKGRCRRHHMTPP